MRALFLQHDPGSRPGLIGAALQRRGYRIELLEMSQRIGDGTWHGTFPDAGDHDLIVPLGAVWSAYDRTQVGSWIDAELELLRAADAAGIPVLGICFGGQSLALAHGGEVVAAERSEIGWTSIDTDDASLIPRGPWMQWHGDRFTVPEGGTQLARGPLGPQAFRLRRNLGLQFHPEVDEANVAHWIGLAGDDATSLFASAGTDVDTVLADARANAATAAANVEVLVDAFLTRIATS